MCVCVCVCVCVYIHIYICVCVCVHVYIYIYINHCCSKHYEGCVVGQDSCTSTVPVGLVPDKDAGFPHRLLISPYQPPYHQSSLLPPDSLAQRTQFSSIPVPTHIGNTITDVSEGLWRQFILLTTGHCHCHRLTCLSYKPRSSARRTNLEFKSPKCKSNRRRQYFKDKIRTLLKTVWNKLLTASEKEHSGYSVFRWVRKIAKSDCC